MYIDVCVCLLPSSFRPEPPLLHPLCPKHVSLFFLSFPLSHSPSLSPLFPSTSRKLSICKQIQNVWEPVHRDTRFVAGGCRRRNFQKKESGGVLSIRYRKGQVMFKQLDDRRVSVFRVQCFSPAAVAAAEKFRYTKQRGPTKRRFQELKGTAALIRNSHTSHHKIGR